MMIPMLSSPIKIQQQQMPCSFPSVITNWITSSTGYFPKILDLMKVSENFLNARLGSLQKWQVNRSGNKSWDTTIGAKCLEDGDIWYYHCVVDDSNEEMSDGRTLDSAPDLAML